MENQTLETTQYYSCRISLLYTLRVKPPISFAYQVEGRKGKEALPKSCRFSFEHALRLLGDKARIISASGKVMAEGPTGGLIFTQDMLFLIKTRAEKPV